MLNVKTTRQTTLCFHCGKFIFSLSVLVQLALWKGKHFASLKQKILSFFLHAEQVNSQELCPKLAKMLLWLLYDCHYCKHSVILSGSPKELAKQPEKTNNLIPKPTAMTSPVTTNFHNQKKYKIFHVQEETRPFHQSSRGKTKRTSRNELAHSFLTPSIYTNKLFIHSIWIIYLYLLWEILFICGTNQIVNTVQETRGYSLFLATGFRNWFRLASIAANRFQSFSWRFNFCIRILSFGRTNNANGIAQQIFFFRTFILISFGCLFCQMGIFPSCKIHRSVYQPIDKA